MTDPTSLPSFGFPAGDDAVSDGVPDGVPVEVPGTPLGIDEELRARVVDALTADGHEPTIDEDGDVALHVQDQMVFIRCVESQPPLMRVFGQWLLDDSLGGDELTRLRAANAVTGAVNLVKVSIDGDRLSVAVDLVVAPGLELAQLLAATLDAVLGSVRTWYQVVSQLLGSPNQ
jgi:hypothetical protein